MIVNQLTTDIEVKDLNGESFIPLASIEYTYAFCAVAASNSKLLVGVNFTYQQIADSIHQMLIFWLGENSTGKFSCLQCTLIGKTEYVYFEDMQDAMLFKLMFS